VRIKARGANAETKKKNLNKKYIKNNKKLFYNKEMIQMLGLYAFWAENVVVFIFFSFSYTPRDFHRIISVRYSFQTWKQQRLFLLHHGKRFTTNKSRRWHCLGGNTPLFMYFQLFTSTHARHDYLS